MIRAVNGPEPYNSRLPLQPLSISRTDRTTGVGLAAIEDSSSTAQICHQLEGFSFEELDEKTSLNSAMTRVGLAALGTGSLLAASIFDSSGLGTVGIISVGLSYSMLAYSIFNNTTYLNFSGWHRSNIPTSVETSKVEVVELSYSNIDRLPPILTSCHRLRELYLDSSQIQDLPEDFNFPKLKILKLNCTRTYHFPERFHLPYLESLDLSSTGIRSLPREFNFSLLKTLTLKQSAITSIERDFCPPYLETLDIRGCNLLTSLPETILNLPNSCTVYLTLSNFPRSVQDRLRAATSQEDYLGPRFEFDMATASMTTESPEPNIAMQKLLDHAFYTHNANDLLEALLQNADSPEITRGNIHIWLDRIFLSASANTENKKAFFRSIVENLIEVSRSDELRSFFQDLVGGTTSTCGDGITLSTLQIANQVKAKNIDINDPKALYQFLVHTIYAMDILHKIADNFIPTLPFTDPIEVYLGLPLKLKDEFNIEINIDEMLFFNYSGLRPQHIDQARANLSNALSNKDQVIAFLIEQPKWLDHLRLKFPQQYEPIVDRRFKEAEHPEMAESAEASYKEALSKLSMQVIG